MKAKSLKINALLNGLRSLMSVLFPLITFPYVSRILNVSGIGKYNFSASIISYFQLLASLGISTYAIREGARYRNSKKIMSQFINEMFSINIISATLSYSLLIVCLFLFPKLHSYTLCILIFSLEIIFSVISVDWLFTIYEDFAYITLRSILFQVISIALLFTFVRKQNDYLIYTAITAFSVVGSNIFNFIKASKNHRFKLVFGFNYWKHLSPILILFAVNIANIIYVNSDITILGFLKNNYIVGIYSISSRIYSIIKTVIAAILIVTIPRLAYLIGQKNTKEYNILLKKLTGNLIVLTLPASVGLFMLSKQVILVISGYKYLRSTLSLQILSIAYIFSILAWILSDCVLIPTRNEKRVLTSMTISAIVNVILNIIFVPSLSEIAAAISTVIAEVVMFLFNLYYSKRVLQYSFISKKIVLTILQSLSGCLGIIFVCRVVLSFTSSLFLQMVFSVILSIVVYIAILLIEKNEYIFSIMKLVQHRI